MSASAPHPVGPDISAVVAVYKCRPCLEALYERLVKSLSTISSDFEIVFVDDCGGDGSWEFLADLALRDSRVRALKFSRNFGQHAAITAGLAEARGRWVTLLDCDLQDPPEEIPRLYAKATEGYDVVFARRTNKPASLPRRLAARAYFKLLNTFGGTNIDGQYGTFSIISRKVVDAYLRVGDKDRHYLFILYWLGFSTAAVDYEPAERFAGKSSYGFAKLIRHAADGAFFQTTALLRWIVYLGFTLAGLGALAAVYLVVSKITGSAYPGFTAIAVIVLTIGGFIIISTGITGLYIGKVFDQVKDRPLFVIDRSVSRGVEVEHVIEPDEQLTR